MINLDFNKRIVIPTDEIDWQPSGLPGIDLKPLAIEDSETGHLTALIRYREGSSFTRKERSNGEEMLVLAGSFRGQYADYGTGTYYRSPPNHEQIPLSQQGCIMLLKLNQFEDGDELKVVTNTEDGEWSGINNNATQVQILHKTLSSQTLIYKWEKGEEISSQTNQIGGAEAFVLKGRIKDKLGEYTAGTWLRTSDRLFDGGVAIEDSAAFVKYGHIRTSKN